MCLDLAHPSLIIKTKVGYMFRKKKLKKKKSGMQRRKGELDSLKFKMVIIAQPPKRPKFASRSCPKQTSTLRQDQL